MNPVHFGPILTPKRHRCLSKPFYYASVLLRGVWRSSASYGFSQNASRTGVCGSFADTYSCELFKTLCFFRLGWPCACEKQIVFLCVPPSHPRPLQLYPLVVYLAPPDPYDVSVFDANALGTRFHSNQVPTESPPAQPRCWRGEVPAVS